jgi:UDP-2,3-diacylglucosamine pyrophosphatase LpxH
MNLLNQISTHSILPKALRLGAASNNRPAQSLQSDTQRFATASLSSLRDLTVRTLWISDVHLGTKDCKAHELLTLLKHVEAETIYLVGDIIDGWQLKKRWHWPQAHNDVVQKLLRKARKGAHVVFIAGNHDEFAKQFIGLDFGGIEVATEKFHNTLDGRKLWVVHGDHLDGVIQHAKWLAKLGDELYLFTLKLNNWLNHLRKYLNLPYWSLSSFLKQQVKNAVAYIDSFERALALEARDKHCDGVVCGHIHKAEIRVIHHAQSNSQTEYHNCGDWVESCTALIEDYSGAIRLISINDLQHIVNTQGIAHTHEEALA